MRKTILIDFYKVLSYENFWSGKLSGADPLKDIEAFVFRDNMELVNDWMRGKYSSEQIHDFIEESLGFFKSELFPIFVEERKSLEISELLVSKLRELREDYQIILVTDNMDCLDRWTIPNNLETFSVFHQIYNSCNLGLLKTDDSGKVFKVIAKEQGLHFENCFLIDDSVKNCEFFEQLGGTSYNVTGEENVLKVLQDKF